MFECFRAEENKTNTSTLPRLFVLLNDRHPTVTIVQIHTHTLHNLIHTQTPLVCFPNASAAATTSAVVAASTRNNQNKHIRNATGHNTVHVRCMNFRIMLAPLVYRRQGDGFLGWGS